MTETMEPLQGALAGLDAMGASATDRRLVELLASHVREEGAILRSYQDYAENSPSELGRYLARLICDDEARHHRVLIEMANAIAWQDASRSPSPAMPPLPVTPAGDPDLRRATAALLAAERRDRRELRRLAGELRPFRDTTAWALVVDLMRADTEKHIRILRFLLDHVTG